MNTSVTVVTGLYNIKRETNGDGRKINDYIMWLKKTTRLNVPMVIYCEQSTYEQIKDERSDYEHTKFIVIEKKDIEYFQYEDKVNEIVKSQDYLTKIRGRERLEVKLPIYNLLIMNKIIWLSDAARENYFNSNMFMWVDAGCSRFFENYDLNQKKPWPNVSKLNPEKFNIQIKQSLFNNLNPNDIMYHNDHFTTATIFSGTKQIIDRIKDESKRIFEEMIEHNCINNEQIVFAIIYKKYPELFHGLINNTHKHIPYFGYLCN